MKFAKNFFKTPYLANTYCLIKSTNIGDQARGFLRLGGGFLGILKSALIGCMSASGGSPSAISIAVMPKDQISQRTS